MNRDFQTLNLLPEELSETLKESLGMENLSRYVQYVDGESSRKTRRINEESKGIDTIVSSQENSMVKQVTQDQNRLKTAENNENVKKLEVVKLPEHSSPATQTCL
ncbi:hypothetical protein L1987_06797 [Smallanthus sonchifolius]|uniref:Uncharacterized protein n=1 Tax=Smallanthus sonchifolius TaxID=185202 RepID=A0ACB9JZ33_9ASTR|nr:hypothetical protein L1987_06797 [Smallanthus sonchifolius]